MPTTFRLSHPPALADAAAGNVAAVAPATPAAGAVAAVAQMPTAATSSDGSTPDWWIVVGAFVIVLVVWAAATLLIKDKNFSPTKMPVPVPGLTILGVFFVAAQAIERLLEPIASYFTPAATAAMPGLASEAADQHQKAVVKTLVGAADAADAREQAVTALNKAADNKAAADRWNADRKILFWAIASAIAVLASASLKLYLLKAVGVASAPRALDILATGLIIGGGTGPLHDLVTLISAKADTSKAAAA